MLIRTLALTLLVSLLALLPWSPTPTPAAAADPVPSTVSLAVDNEQFATNETASLTATLDVALTGEDLVIWDVTNGAAVATCNWGDSCQAQVSWPVGGPRQYQAFVGSSSATPAAARLTSGLVEASRQPWAVTLSVDKATFASDETATLTATANQPADYNSGGYVLQIVDQNSGQVVAGNSAECITTDTCVASVRFATGAPRTYIARAVLYGGNVAEAVSNTVTTTRKPWVVNLTADKSVFGTDEYVTLTATANQPAAYNSGGYVLEIVDQTTGRVIAGNSAECINTDVCVTTTHFGRGGPHTYQARAVLYGDTRPEAVSNTVSATRKRWTLVMTRDGDVATATANQPPSYNYGGHLINIKSAYGYTVAECAGDGENTCVAYVEASRSLYGRVVAYPGYDDMQADTNGFSADTGRTAATPAETVGGGDPSATTPQCHCADPVNTATGEFYENITDLTQPGRLPLTWTRSYSATNASEDSVLGHGWTAPFDMRVIESQTPGEPTRVVAENGAETHFAHDPVTDTYKAAPNVRATLVERVDGTWVFTRDHDTRFEFNASGALTAVTDSNGETLSLTRNGAGQVTAMGNGTSALSIVYGTTGSAEGRITSVTAPGGRTVAYAYDAAGDLTTVTDPRGKVTRYDYDAQHRVVSMTDPRGGVTTNDYDAQGRVNVQTDAEGGETAFAYSSPTTVGTSTTRVTDPAGRVTDYLYDNGWLAKKTTAPDEDPRTWTFYYDASGHPSLVTDPLGRSTYSLYDADGNKTSTTDPAGAETTWDYNATGRVTSSTDARGNTTTFTYNARGNLTQATAPVDAARNAVTTFTYANATHPGDVTSSTDARGNTTAYAYNAAGLLNRTTTPGGRITTHTYDAAGRLATTTSPRGNVTGADPTEHRTAYTYNASGLITSATDATGAVTSFTYDNADNLATLTDPSGAQTAYAYDGLNRATSMTDPRGKISRSTFDATGLPLSLTDPAGSKTTYTYNAHGEPVSTTSPYGNATGADATQATTTLSRDAAGQIAATTTPDPLGGVIETAFTYDRAGRVRTTTDALGGVTTQTYSPTGQVVAETNPAGATTEYDYNDAGWVTGVTDALDHTSTLTYDVSGNLLASTDALGNTTTFDYSVDNLMTSVTEPRGNISGANAADFTTAFAYDPDGNQTTVTDPLGAVTTASFDALGRVTDTENAEGEQTGFDYDNRGLLESITNPDGGVAAYAYDPAGNRTSTTDAEGNTTAYSYDDASRLASQTDPLGRTQVLGYDAAGALTMVQRTRGRTDYQRDALGRLTGIDYSDSTPDVSYVSDRLGRRTSMTDGSGTTTYAYTPDGLPSTISRGGTGFSYTYDAARRLVASNGPNGALAYDYDAADRPVTMTRDDGTGTPDVTGYTYDPTGAITSLSQPNGVETDRSYDRAGHLVSIDVERPDDSGLTRAYDLDDLGRPTALDITTDSGVGAASTTARSWLYDSAGRVTAECPAATCTTGAADETWSYDLVGSITEHATTGAIPTTDTFDYDAAGQVDSLTRTTGTGATSTPEVFDFIYDADGNMTTSDSGTYDWDLANRLTQVEATASGPDTITDYTYDGDGNRVGSEAVTEADPTTGTGAESASTSYDWDLNALAPGLPMLARTSTSTTDAGGTTASAAAYTYGPDGALNGSYGTGDAPAEVYATTDMLGSVIDQADASGVSLTSQDYTPYGQRRGPPGGTGSLEPGVDSTLGFTGQQSDATGLLYMRARYYDPALGIFLSTDPAGGALDPLNDQNPYAYVSGNPLLYTDPSGLGPEDWRWTVMGFSGSAQGLLDVGHGVGRGVSDTAVGTYDLAYDIYLDPAVPERRQQMAEDFDAGYARNGVAGVLHDMTALGNLYEAGVAYCEGDTEEVAYQLTMAGPSAAGWLGAMKGLFRTSPPKPNLSPNFGPKSLGAAQRLRYEASPKHGATQRGRAAPAPSDGQAILGFSVPISPNTTARRVGVDRLTGEYVVFDETHPGSGVFHGHAMTDWKQVRHNLQRAMIRGGLVDRKGRML